MAGGGAEHLSGDRLRVVGEAIVSAADTTQLGLSVVFVDGPSPSYAYLSPRGAEILGHPHHELVNRPLLSTVAPDEIPKLEARTARRAAGDTVPTQFETAVITKDGRRVPLEVSLADVTLDGRRAVVCFFTDISERVRVVGELAALEARFRQIIESAPEAVWIFDGGALRFVNPAVVQMLGYPDAASVLAIHPRDLVHPDERGPLIERTREMFESGKPMLPREYRTYRQDGSVIMVEVSSIPIEFEGRRAVLCFGRDVTPRKRMEAQLVQTDRLSALGTLTAGIAHEINNPLAYVLMNLELAQRSAHDDPVLRERLQQARHGAERVAGIVRQLRAFSRFEPEARVPVELPRVLETVLRMAESQLRPRAHVRRDYRPVPAVRASATQLEQVFLNLVLNAAQAIPEGKPGEHSVLVATGTDDDGRAVVEVRDTGLGIADDVLPHIFDPFYTTKPAGLGTGLGLSICHGIVTAHGGEIGVQTSTGRGSTFRVTLPACSDDATAPQSTESSADAVAPRRRTLLVVDDEPRIADALRRLLGSDHDVMTVTDARDALELLRKVRFDAVMCDLMMPGMSGMDLYQEISTRDPPLARRFIFITGGAYTPRAADFLASNDRPRLDKPFDAAALRAALELVAGGG